MQTDLKEKIALVTGASSGLGAQFARTLAANGALVVLAARRVERLKDLRAEIEAEGGAADVVPLDVTDLDSVAAAVAKIESENGPIDILINNSGVSTTQRLVDVSAVDFDHVFGTNVKGAFFVAQQVAKRMIARSRQQRDFRGRIVNIASVAGLKVVPQIGLYCMSKSAVIQMTRAQALEWGRYGINGNAICPGYIRTEINDAHWETESGQKLIQMLPRRRVGTPADLDSVLLMLVADESQFINGAVISADDGLSVT
ncbi:MAG: SDR family oxidoreductase [Burkholderiaceae bacterium]|nr:SDR family oxidoreductase [Burkholderiaceae bacterium]